MHRTHNAFSHTVNPINHGFAWTDDGWYVFDSKAAHAEARKVRDREAAEYKASGRAVRKFSQAGCLMTRGGIGSGHPQIEEIVTVFGFTVA